MANESLSSAKALSRPFCVHTQNGRLDSPALEADFSHFSKTSVTSKGIFSIPTG